ncbi:MAG TPA: hypothetical protein V6C65_42405, partial [Allocoleopsis sp.]
MHTLKPTPFAYTLSPQQYNQLQQLLEKTAQEIGAIVVTEAALPVGFIAAPGTEQFTLTLSDRFIALLRGQKSPEDRNSFPS